MATVPITFVATLTDRGDCLKFDAEGSARLVLDLSAQEAAGVASALPRLMNCALGIAVQPLRKGK